MGREMTARRLHAVALISVLALVFAPQALADPDAPAPTPVAAADAAASVTPPEGVPHLPSPDNLPPGATQTAPEHRNLSYLREIWQAVRGQNITMSDALLLIAQRPMDTPNPSP